MSQLLKCDHCGTLCPETAAQLDKDKWQTITTAKAFQSMPATRTYHLCGPCFKETFPS